MKFVVGMVVVFWLPIEIVTAFASWEKASKTKIPTAVEARCRFHPVPLFSGPPLIGGSSQPSRDIIWTTRIFLEQLRIIGELQALQLSGAFS